MTRHRLSFLLHPERSGRVTLTARVTCEGIRKVDVSIGASVGPRPQLVTSLLQKRATNTRFIALFLYLCRCNSIKGCKF